MTRRRVILEVARWEFRRFFKLRQQVVSLVLTLAVAALSYGLTTWIRGSGTAKVAALNAPAGLAVPSGLGVHLVDAAERSAAGLHRQVAARALDGALLFSGPDDVTLIVRGTPPWAGPLQDAITALRRQQRLQAGDIDAAVIERLFRPVAFRVEHVGSDRQVPSANRAAAIILGALMMMGIWVGLAYMFVGITGEKQSRITEQVVSAISAQGWMDGKILGLSVVAAASTAGYVVSGLVLVGAARLAGMTISLPSAVSEPMSLFVMATLALLGFAFWNTFIAAVAALITDPQSSSRGGFIMLPLVPVAVAMAAIGRPDAFPIRLLSLLPPTAPPVMLTRLVVGHVSWWEQVAAIALLVGAIWLTRRVAGRIFRTSMLLYGQEPSWSEVWRWLRVE